MTALPFTHITTKLHIPATRPKLLSRPRLVSQLSRCAQHKLLLVLAPAGFGKTTTLCEWSQESEWPVAWVSLDETDNDPVRFWSYLIAALDRLEPRVGQNVLPFVHTPRPSPTEYLIPTLINTANLIADDFCLVLDDYFCVESQAIHDALAYLLDYAPPNMHLIIASRAEPPMPLARWRAQGQLGELCAADLCFTEQETKDLLGQVLALDLSDETVEALQAQTEGWVTGLQLAALALSKQASHPQALERAFQGDQLYDRQYIVDYMASEVLSQQPADIQRFLLQTSILPTLSAPLCNVVTGRTDGATILGQLHQGNLFITALNCKGQYRYHRLFADLLWSKLADDPLYDVEMLHLRAASWHQEQGDPTSAIRHYLAAGHEDRALDLIEDTARAHLMRGELGTLQGWFDALPDQAIQARPLLSLVCGWVLTHACQVDKAAQFLDHLDDRDPGPLPGELDAVRARMAVIRGDNAEMIRLSKQALALLPADAITLRSDAMLDLAFAYGASGDPQGTLEALSQAIELSRQAGNLRTAMLSLYYLGDTYIAQGQHHRAARLYQEGLRWCQQNDPPSAQACWAHAGLGALLYEWNDLDGAFTHLQQAVRLARQAGEVKVLMYPRMHLARAYQTAGRTEDALAALQAAAEIAEQTRITDIENQINVVRIQVWTRAGQLDAAANWLQRHGISLQGDTGSHYEGTMLAWYHLDANRDQAALARVAELAQAQCDERYPLSMVQNLALVARAHQALGQQDQAAAEISQCLALGEPMGLVRTFVDHGAPMAQLLTAAAAQRKLPVGNGYVARLLEAIEKTGPSLPATSPRPEPPASQALFEPLRPREIEVLQHVAVGHSNSEIADQMVMAVSTVKWYLRIIYGKLHVHRRTHAVARAKELALI